MASNVKVVIDFPVLNADKPIVDVRPMNQPVAPVKTDCSTINSSFRCSNSNSNLLKQQSAKSHLQVAKTMIKHATYAYYI